MKTSDSNITRTIVIIALALGIIMTSLKIFADDDHEEHGWRWGKKYQTERGLREIPVATNAQWKTECTSCHMAYLPNLLPERSWKKMMNGLEDHFGENASLDESARKEITDFLVQNSSDRVPSKRGGKILKTIGATESPLRISETKYFIRKHDEIDASVYKRKSIGSAANCLACHGGAEKGRFDEDEVSIPRDTFKKPVLAPAPANK